MNTQLDCAYTYFLITIPQQDTTIMGDIFRSKAANAAFEDLNMGAGSLRVEEVRPKNSIPAVLAASTSIQFEWSSPGRYIALSESYLEISFTCAASAQGQTTHKALNEDQLTSDGAAAATNRSNHIDMVLQKHWPDLAINAIRHSISGTQVESTNEPALQRSFMETAQQQGYSEAAATAFCAGTFESRQAQLSTGTKHTIAWRPPLGLWQNTTLIPGSGVHRLDIDTKDISQYIMTVFEASLTGGGVAADGLSLTDFVQIGDTTAATGTQQFMFGIETIVLRCATISPQDGRLPPASMMLETRTVEIQRLPAGQQPAVDRQILIPGSTFKIGVMHQQDDDYKPDNRRAHPSLREDTKLVNQSLHVDGVQLPAPEYVFSLTNGARDHMRPYIDFLTANGSLTSENATASSGCSVSFEQYADRPLYLARLVSAPGLAKDLLVRCRFSGNTANKSVIVGSYHTKAVAMTFDSSGNISSVQVTGL